MNISFQVWAASACDGKQTFLTFGQANKIAKRRRRMGTSRDARTQHAYRCAVCKHWHIGHRG